MSEFKGTPGPWVFKTSLNEDFESDVGGFVGKNNKTVCWFGDDEQYYPTAGCIPEQEDINLIEAAPDLLKALQQSLKIWENLKLDVSEASILLDCREAIAKALGK